MSESGHDDIISRLPLDTLASFHAHKVEPPASPNSVALTVKIEATASQGTGGVEAAASSPDSPQIERGFELKDVIGRGGHGEVWEAEQPSLGRRVAIKKIRSDIYDKYALEPERIQWFEASFRLEALATARLEHPNIVPVHTFEQAADGTLLLAMKLVRGRSWHELLDEEFDHLPVADFLAKHLAILVGVTQAVAFAHAQGIVHRDLKPAQVMIGEFGEVALMDWGIAVAYGNPTAEVVPPQDYIRGLPTPATASSPGGTLAFMAPEQTEQTAARVGPWTDVYLLGGILYMILTGHPPHPGETREAAYFQACTGVVPSPSTLASGRAIPAELSAIALRALKADPGDRYQTAAEFLNELNDFVTGATKRRASTALVSEVQTRLEDRSLDYASMTELLAKLDQAKIFWPENGDIPATRTRLLFLQTDLAITNGDLVLAGTTLDRIDDLGALVTLRPKLERARANHESQRRQRQYGIAASFILAVLLAAGSYVAYHKASKDRDSIRSARGASEELVRFMMTDLRERLAPTDPDLTALGPTADKIVEHYLRQDPAQLSQAELKSLVEGMGDAASILATQGNFPGALRASEARHRIIDKAEALFPGRREWIYARVSDTLLLTSIHYTRGHPELARDAMELARAKIEEFSAAYGDDAALANYRQAIRAEYSQYLSLVGDHEGAKRELEATIAHWEAQLSGTQKEFEHRAINLGAMYARMGIVQERLGNRDAVGECHRKSLAFYRELVGRRDQLRDRYLVSVALMNVADHEEFLGNISKAKDLLTEAKENLTSILKIQGVNAEYALALHNVYITLSRYASERGELEDAGKIFEADLALVKPFAERDPGNLEWRRAYWVVLARSGSIALSNGDRPKAIMLNLEVINDSAEAMKLHPNSESLINDRLTQASNLAQVIDVDINADLDRAREILEEVIAAASGSLEDSPNRMKRTRELGVAYGQLGRLYNRSQDEERGADAYRRSLECARAVAAGTPESYTNARDVMAAEYRLTTQLMRSHKVREGIESMRAVVSSIDQIATDYPETPSSVPEAAVLRGFLGEYLMLAGEYAEAERNLAASWEVLEKSREEGRIVGDFLANAHSENPLLRAQILHETGRAAEAIELEATALRTNEENYAAFGAGSTARDQLMRSRILGCRGKLLRGDSEGALECAGTALPEVSLGGLLAEPTDERPDFYSLMALNEIAHQALVALGRDEEAAAHRKRAGEIALHLLETKRRTMMLADMLDCIRVLGAHDRDAIAPFVVDLKGSGFDRPDVVELIEGPR